MLNQDYPRFIKICKNPNLGKSIPGVLRFGNLKTLISIIARIGQPKMTNPPNAAAAATAAGQRRSAAAGRWPALPHARVRFLSHVRSSTITGGHRLRPTYVHYVRAL